jgi:DNA repair exonuclease SbcCD ATPase subunit
MTWQCPECDSLNDDDYTKCVCGYKVATLDDVSDFSNNNSGLSEEESKQLEKLMQWVVTQSQSYRSEEEIVADLVESGWDNKRAESFVQAVLNRTAPKPSLSSRVFSKSRGIIIILLVFAGLNGVLYIGQELYYADDVKKCEDIEIQIASMKSEIDQIEKYISSVEIERKKINNLEQSLMKNVSVYLNEADYERDYNKYSKMIDAFNSKFSQVEKAIKRYDELIEKHNGQVELYNTIAETAYSRWYLIPIHGGHSHSIGKHAVH